jgi:hypothetical protein
MFMAVRFLISVGLALLLVSTVAGQDGLALMKVEAGARPAGMAGAFASVTGDPNSSAYNPAAAAGVDRFTASFGHNTYWENIRLETGYFTTNLMSRVWLHGGIRYAAVNDIESRLSPTSEPDAYLDAHDISFKGGLAFRVLPKLTAGIGAGWYLEKIDQYRGSSFNVDFGLTYVPYAGVTIGAAAQNLGSDFSLSISGHPGSDPITLPTTYRVGGSYKYRYCLGAADVVIVDDEAHLHAGVETWIEETAALRAGYMTGYDTKSATAGMSFRHRNFTIDYAFVPYSGSLGTAHLFNLTVSI